ncbi:MAG: hypothetical protein U1F67_19455 [Rubrivivax sp.]
MAPAALGARIGLVDLLRSGCTTVADHHYLYWPGQGYDPAEVLFDEAERLGLRFMLLRGGGAVARTGGSPGLRAARRWTRSPRVSRATSPASTSASPMRCAASRSRRRRSP